MEILVNGMMKGGGGRERLKAKVFGGGHVMSKFSTIHVGEQNVSVIDQCLASERIPVVSRDVLDVHPRKVCLFPGSGRALVKKLAAAQASGIATQEAAARGSLSRTPAQSAAGSVELF